MLFTFPPIAQDSKIHTGFRVVSCALKSRVTTVPRLSPGSTLDAHKYSPEMRIVSSLQADSPALQFVLEEGSLCVAPVSRIVSRRIYLEDNEKGYEQAYSTHHASELEEGDLIRFPFTPMDKDGEEIKGIYFSLKHDPFRMISKIFARDSALCHRITVEAKSIPSLVVNGFLIYPEESSC